MDELLVLLIKGIIRALSGPPQKGPQQRVPVAPAALPGFQQRPGNVATARRPGLVTERRPAPPPRRGGRRPTSTLVGVAAPILTPTGAEPALPTTITAATTIRASRGSVLDKSDARSAASPTDVRRWLTPAALRQQVVLAEILGKPLALRDER